MKDWAVTIGLACLVGLACFFWGRSTIQEKDHRDTTTVFLPTIISLPETTYVTKVQTVMKPVTVYVEAPGNTTPTSDSVVATTPVTLRDDTVTVEFNMQTTYKFGTMTFRHSFSGIRVLYPKEVIFTERVVTEPGAWWVRPVIALSAVGCGVAIEKKEYGWAAGLGAISIIGVTIPF